MKIRFIFLFFLSVYLSVEFLVPEPFFGIRKNLSNSLPYSFFLSTRIKEIKHNMYVSLEHPLSSVLLAKEVIGIPGDRINIENRVFWINDRAYGLIQEKTSSGNVVHPIQEGIIPEGCVFVYASHPLSYDSRYSEFGLVSISQMKEKLCPIF